MAKSKTVIVNFPNGTDLDNFVYHYAALLNAHGVPNTLPNAVQKYTELTHPLPEMRTMLLQDFKMANAEIYKFKNDQTKGFDLTNGAVTLTDMKIVGNKAHLIFKLGK